MGWIEPRVENAGHPLGKNAFSPATIRQANRLHRLRAAEKSGTTGARRKLASMRAYTPPGPMMSPGRTMVSRAGSSICSMAHLARPSRGGGRRVRGHGGDENEMPPVLRRAASAQLLRGSAVPLFERGAGAFHAEGRVHDGVHASKKAGAGSGPPNS